MTTRKCIYVWPWISSAFSARASSGSITGMSSRIGYARRHALHTSSCADFFHSSGPLQTGQTRISSSFGFIDEVPVIRGSTVCFGLLRLALIKMDIGDRQQRYQVVTVARGLGNPEAHRHRQAVALAPGLGARFDARVNLAYGRIVALRQDGDELVAAPAPAHTPIGRLAKDPRELGQHAVAHTVAVAVVNRLELVEVGEQHGRRRALVRLVEHLVGCGKQTVAV